MNDREIPPPSTRREFLGRAAAAAGMSVLALGRAEAGQPPSSAPPAGGAAVPGAGAATDFGTPPRHQEGLPPADRIAFPMGGIGAGMICLEGSGSLTSFSLLNRPDLFNEPCVFAALFVAGTPSCARVLEGPVPQRKLFGRPGGGEGCVGLPYGLPRFDAAHFSGRFPLGQVRLSAADVPLSAELVGWSPFVPGDADLSSLPVAALEYRFANPTSAAVSAVFSFNAENFMGTWVGAGDERRLTKASIGSVPGGFVFRGPGGAFAAAVSDPAAKVNHAWFRGGWWDPLTMAWRDVANGACFERPLATGGPQPSGATLFVPFDLAPGQTKTIALRLSWYCPESGLRWVAGPSGSNVSTTESGAYRPWYAGRFADLEEVDRYWADRYDDLRAKTEAFSECFYDSTLPGEAIEAVAANLSILKSPTVLRQTDGRLWMWEGSNDEAGSGHGSCTHVWNYAQATAHLFPALERTLRETEFGPLQNDEGCQAHRSDLPIRKMSVFMPAADGQLGGILKVHRDWRISGDTAWLRGLWPRVRSSLDFCIRTWDPGRKGWIETPHHNTYDIDFKGPTGMATSFYLGALQAVVLMGEALSDDVSGYRTLLETGTRRCEAELFNGEYFIQRVDRGAAKPPAGENVPEEAALFEQEGPKYQYGTGCLSDGVVGCWLALVCGVGQILDRAQVRSHAVSVHRHNLKKDLSNHADTQRPGYAAGREGGLLLCTWPNGAKPSLPFPYCDEVWTGIEYQVASHLILLGAVEPGLEIVRTCRARYDGRTRNPFDEYEYGHWYGRALSSYSLLQALSGARYDAVSRTLHLEPSVRGDFRSFLATASGFGTVGVRGGKPFLEVKSGRIDASRIAYTPAA